MLNRIARFLLTEQRLAEMGYRQETQEDRDALLPVIEFLCEPNHKGVIPEPKPAMKNIAEWWKKIPAHLPKESNPPRDHFGASVMTAKKCMPLLDGMALGYTLFTASDIHVRTNAEGTHMELTSGPFISGASMHDLIQLGGQTSPTYPGPAIKFHSPWIIKTRPGYSTLFLPPLNAFEEDRFTCLGAVVDTDTYAKQVNFPGVFHKKGFDGDILAGTPIITAIPFKRSEVPTEVITRIMHSAEKLNVGKIERQQNSRSHVYTSELREPRK